MIESTSDPTIDAFAAAELKKSVRSGATVLAVAQVASQIISLVGLAVLLRKLTPADYGLVGMVVPLILFLRIFTTLGLNVATVQRPDLKPEETSALFWLNVLFGCATTGVMLLVAPYLGSLYQQSNSAIALRNVAWALASTSIVAALGAQHQALLERNLRLRPLSAIRIVAQLGAAVLAILAAYSGWGVWALVVQQYSELVILSGLSWIVEPWRPIPPTRSAVIADHLRLGGYFAAASVVFYMADNLDRILIGRLVGPEAVGLYGQAYNVMIKPVYLVTTPLVALMLASLSRAAEQPETRRELVVGYYRLLAILLMPASAGLAVVGGDVMRLLGGEAWAAAGPLLSVLSVGMFGQALVIMGVPVLTAAGRVDRLFAASLVVAAVVTAAYLCGWWFGKQWGEPVAGVAWGYAIAIVCVIAVPYTCYCLKTVGYPPENVARQMCVNMLLALAMAGVVLAASEGLTRRGVESPLARLTIELPLGALVYAIVARRELKWLVGQARQLRTNNAG